MELTVSMGNRHSGLMLRGSKVPGGVIPGDLEQLGAQEGTSQVERGWEESPAQVVDPCGRSPGAGGATGRQERVLDAGAGGQAAPPQPSPGLRPPEPRKGSVDEQCGQVRGETVL